MPEKKQRTAAEKEDTHAMMLRLMDEAVKEALERSPERPTCQMADEVFLEGYKAGFTKAWQLAAVASVHEELRQGMQDMAASLLEELERTKR